IAVDAHFAGELAVGGVVARQVGIGVRVAEVVDRDDLDFLRALRFIQCPQRVAADAPVPVDAYLDCHDPSFLRTTYASSLPTAATMWSAVMPKCLDRSAALPE